MTIALASGLLAGVLHVLCGPDHLAAIAPLAIGSTGAGSRRCAGLGARWGWGHSAGVLLVAALALLARESFPAPGSWLGAWLGGWSERLVGVTLLAIGAWGLRKTLESPRPPRRELASAATADERAPARAAFAVGSLHGLAGGAHVLGVLPALALPNALQSALYLAGFAAGTVAAMASFSLSVAGLARRSAAPLAGRRWLAASSAAALAVGAWWLIGAPRS